MARHLEGKAECFFITPDIYTNRRLFSYGIPADRILDISITKKEMRGLPPPSEDMLGKAAEYEKHGPTLPSLVMMSQRFYHPRDARSLYTYIVKSAARAEEFLVRNKIGWVISEPTVASEIISYTVCDKLGINAANMTVTRHPLGRVALFRGLDERALYPLSPGGTTATEQETLKWIEEFRKKGEPPVYFEIQNRQRTIFSLFSSVLKRTGITLQEAAGTNQLNYTNLRCQAEIYSRRFRTPSRGLDKTFTGEAFAGDPRPYAIYYLHIQPERTVDVIAPYNDNQLELIKGIRRALPSAIRLAVKEHPSGTGAQPPEFYSALKNIPDVSLIAANHDSLKAARNALFTATISGTIGMEAALLDVPSVVFSSVFFSNMPNAVRLDSPAGLEKILPAILAHKKNRNDAALASYIRGIIDNSEPCLWNGTYGWQSPEIVKSFSRLILRAAGR